MPKVKFVPLNTTVELKNGETLFKAARVHGIPIGSSCRGDCVCGWCKVEILEGMENLSEPGACEKKLMETRNYAHNERVACSARVLGDVSITTGYW
ncbi:MAG TPA: 2Fe-2S iron-sulfur cluster-binding protein [Candidatus Kryptonia bacterium]